MRIYVSGGMTGWENNNEDAFDQAAFVLRGLGHDVQTPVEWGRENGEVLEGDGFNATDEEYEGYLGRDLDLLNTEVFDAVVFIRGWTTSGGAGREGRQAIDEGLDLYTLEFWGQQPDGSFTNASMMPLSRRQFLSMSTTSRLRPGEVREA